MDRSVCQGCAHTFAADALFCPNCGTARARDTTNDLLLGATVGDRYSLKERIGMGASGTIYRGEHVTLRRRVAVKVLHHELSRDDLAIERFRRQATTVGEIENDHIVAVHDFGRTPDGRLYIAMEYLEGETLDERLARGPMPVEEACDVLIQLGEALIESHAIGYVHRDLRPRNLLLSVRRGEANFLKLLDFGLSKLVASEGEAASTSLGMTFGDPHYMSPEQARGEPIDRRADIYSMGCIAYQMLTGKPPFSGGRVFDVLARHVEETPVGPRTLRDDVPEWLDATVLRCLEKRPSRRFVTVFRVCEALREGLRTGEVMDEARARRRETEMPLTVSRVMERLGDRLDADGRMEDADDTRFGQDTDVTDITETPNFDGRRTELGLGAAGSRHEGMAARIVTPVTDDLTEPSPAPEGAIAGEVSDGVPSELPAEPTPAPRRSTRIKTKLPALTPPGSPVQQAAPAGDDEEDEDDLRVTRAVARKQLAKKASTPPPARPEPEPERSAESSYDDRDEYDYYEDDDEAGDSAAGKSWRHSSSKGGDNASISGAWLEEGDALGDSAADLEAGDAEKLRAARRGRGALGPGSGSLSTTDEIYFDAGDGRLKWVIGGVGALALVIALIVVFGGGGGDGKTAANEVAPVDADAAGLAAADAAAMVAADAAPVVADAAPVAVDAAVKPDKPAVKPDRPAVKPDKPRNEIDLGLADPYGKPDKTDKPDKPIGEVTAEDKRRADFFAQVGGKHLAGGNVPAAAIEFRKALKLNPANGRAVTGLGQIAMRGGNYAAAIKHLKLASRLRSGSSSVHTLLGEAYMGVGDRGAAAESFKQALRLDPESQRARRGLEGAGGG